MKNSAAIYCVIALSSLLIAFGSAKKIILLENSDQNSVIFVCKITEITKNIEQNDTFVTMVL
jgi:hypothetical protein